MFNALLVITFVMKSAVAEGINGYASLHVTCRDGTLASRSALNIVAARRKSDAAFAKHCSMISP